MLMAVSGLNMVGLGPVNQGLLVPGDVPIWK